MHKKGAEFNEHITRLPTPVVAREIQFKTTMKYHVIPNRTSEILKISLFLIFFCLLLLFFFFLLVPMWSIRNSLARLAGVSNSTTSLEKSFVVSRVPIAVQWK